ncbi:MAG: hypothetical protein JXA20_16885 [Spirochaetes bacterium]|nr:hypothetical protein [Spirochaetota bacterium]
MKKADGRVSSLDMLIRNDSAMIQNTSPRAEDQGTKSRGGRKYLLLLLLVVLVWTGVFVYIRGFRAAPRDDSPAVSKVAQRAGDGIDDGESRGVNQKGKRSSVAPHAKVQGGEGQKDTQVILHDKAGDTSRRKGPVNLGTSLELITN